MRIFLALGGNRPRQQPRLEAAVAALPGLGVAVRGVSSWLRNPPRAMHSRAAFLNGVVEAETRLLPSVLLRRLLLLERRMGRRRAGRGGRPAPRALDLDLILYGRARIRRRDLRIPHPRFAQRRFVLAPLAQLAPALHPPHSPRSVVQLLRSLAG